MSSKKNHRMMSGGKPVVINVEVDPNAIYSFRKDSFKHKE